MQLGIIIIGILICGILILIGLKVSRKPIGPIVFANFFFIDKSTKPHKVHSYIREIWDQSEIDDHLAQFADKCKQCGCSGFVTLQSKTIFEVFL